jgi:hypothetical protein
VRKNKNNLKRNLCERKDCRAGRKGEAAEGSPRENAA